MVKLVIEDNNYPDVEYYLKEAFNDIPDIVDGKIIPITMITEETKPSFKKIKHIFTSAVELKLEGDLLHIKSVLSDSVIDLNYERPIEVEI